MVCYFFNNFRLRSNCKFIAYCTRVKTRRKNDHNAPHSDDLGDVRRFFRNTYTITMCSNQPNSFFINLFAHEASNITMMMMVMMTVKDIVNCSRAIVPKNNRKKLEAKRLVEFVICFYVMDVLFSIVKNVRSSIKTRMFNCASHSHLIKIEGGTTFDTDEPRVSLNMFAVQTDRIAQPSHGMAWHGMSCDLFLCCFVLPGHCHFYYAEAQTNHNSLCANKYGFCYILWTKWNAMNAL